MTEFRGARGSNTGDEVSRTRPITEAESKGLEEEEKSLLSALEHWRQFVPPARPEPNVSITFIDPETTTDVEIDQKLDQSGELGGEDDAPGEQTAFHAAIVANLERMQTDVAKLLTRWRGNAPHESQTERALGEQ